MSALRTSGSCFGTAVLTADRIWVDPDCGLKTRTVEESRAKLGAMMSAVRAARAEID